MVLLHGQGLQVPPSGFGSFQGTLKAGELASPWSQSSALAQHFPGLTSSAYGRFLNRGSCLIESSVTTELNRVVSAVSCAFVPSAQHKRQSFWLSLCSLLLGHARYGQQSKRSECREPSALLVKAIMG